MVFVCYQLCFATSIATPKQKYNRGFFFVECRYYCVGKNLPPFAFVAVCLTCSHGESSVQKQNTLCQSCGHDFVARYIDPEGDLLEEYTGDNKVISEKLQQIIQLKRDKVVCSRKIQIINLSNQIDGISKKITSFRASIADNQEKIASLQSRNQELEDRITLSLSEKEKLVVQLSELELEDTKDTKRLEE